MNPNAMGVLERNGLADQVRRDSWPYLARETRDRRGRLLATRDYKPLYESGKLAQGALVHRAHLLDVLYRSLPPGTVSVRKTPPQRIGRCRSRHRRRRHPLAGAARVLRRGQAALHGLPLAPPDHGERRRRALLYRVSRPRPAHRAGADRREAALRLDDLQLAARTSACAGSSTAVCAIHRPGAATPVRRAAAARRASSPPRSRSCGSTTGCASRRATARCCSAMRRTR